MLKILHTADWHIGKNLHKVPMQDEIKRFFDWLIDRIREEEVDVLLVSGDIFDYANPSAEDRKMYFSFLKQLIDSKTKIIITGGNHDSAGFLNAPAEILGALDISVIGEATADIQDEIVEVRNHAGELQLVVAAVPFLKDKDLRHKNQAGMFANRTEEVRAGIAKHYAEIAEICEAKYSEVPVIAMGHLYTVGADPSESERDIHMGNEAAVGAAVFSKTFDYVALGHIHRPQVIGGNEFIRYSGSPISLSFSEKKDEKSIVMIKVNDGVLSPPQVIPVPKRRELVRMVGKLSEVTQQLADFKTPYKLPAFLEVEIQEDNFSSAVIGAVETLRQHYQDSEVFRIVKSQTKFAKGARDLDELFVESVSIEDLKPVDVFKRKLDTEALEPELEAELKEAFLELVDSMGNED